MIKNFYIDIEFLFNIIKYNEKFIYEFKDINYYLIINSYLANN